MSTNSTRSFTLRLNLFLLYSLSIFHARGNVQTTIDDGRDRLNLGAQLLFDSVQVEPVLVRDQVDRESQVSVTS